MHPRRAYKLSVLLFVLICVSIAVALVLFQLRANINYYYTPVEIVKNTPPAGKNIRLGGYVLKDSIKYLEDGKVRFILTDGLAEINVVYAGLLPNLFAEEEAAIVNGRMGGKDLLVAKQVLAKHDENYRPPEIEELMNRQQ